MDPRPTIPALLAPMLTPPTLSISSEAATAIESTAISSPPISHTPQPDPVTAPKVFVPPSCLLSLHPTSHGKYYEMDLSMTSSHPTGFFSLRGSMHDSWSRPFLRESKMLLVKNMTLQGRARFITQVTGGTGGNAATDKEIKGMGKTGESVTERNQALARVMQVEKAMLVEQERRAEEDRWTEVVTADKGTGTGCQCSPISQCITRRCPCHASGAFCGSQCKSCASPGHGCARYPNGENFEYKKYGYLQGKRRGSGKRKSMEGSIEEGEVEWEGESPLKRRKSAGSSHDHGMENKPGKRGAQV